MSSSMLSTAGGGWPAHPVLSGALLVLVLEVPCPGQPLSPSKPGWLVHILGCRVTP